MSDPIERAAEVLQTSMTETGVEPPIGYCTACARALADAGLLVTIEERRLLDFWARMEARKATPDALKAMLARSLAREAVIDTAKAWRTEHDLTAYSPQWNNDPSGVDLVNAVDALNAIEAKP